MYNAAFYPTPAEVAARMLAHLEPKRLRTASILEPSAGKGDLADAALNVMLADSGGYYSRGDKYRDRIHCVEIHPELQAALRGKGYALVGSDFLSFRPDELYDLILMNPPFGEAEKHLLHAWEILEHGDILCLVNEQTILNPFTAARQRLAVIIDEHGDVEHFGPCFEDAERKTSVRVSLVHLCKEASAPQFDFLTSGMERDAAPEFSDEHRFDGEIATRNTVGNLVFAFDKARALFLDVALKAQELAHYAGSLAPQDNTADILAEAVKELMRGDISRATQEHAYNTYVRGLKKCAWDEVFRLTRAGDLMSAGVRREFHQLRAEQERMAFSETNILSLLDTLFVNRHVILRQCVVEAFDELTRYHEQNRLAVEGWKTNDAWKVNERFILPYVVDSEWSEWHVQYRAQERLADLDRAMAFLEGKRLEDVPVTIDAALRATFRLYKGEASGALTLSTYFEIRPYKKGTCHFKFRDPSLWERFNQVAAEGKNWLPDDYKAREQEARARHKRAEEYGLPVAV